jgi:hypothetical protein
MKKKELLKVIEVALNEKEKQKEEARQILSNDEINEIVQNSGLTIEDFENAKSDIKSYKQMRNAIIAILIITSLVWLAIIKFGFLTVIITIITVLTIIAGIASS